MKRRLYALFFLILVTGLIPTIVMLLRWTEASRGDKFYPHDPGEITTVDFITPERRARVAMEDGQWILVAPVRDLTDRDTMKRIFGVLLSERRSLAMAPREREEWTSLGLSEPVLEMRFHRGGAVDTLRFGDMDAESRKLWAAASWTDSLLLVPTLLRTHFLRNRHDLSDKRAIPLARALDAVSLQIENGHGAYVLKRSDFGWEILAGATFPADQLEVLELLRQISGPTIVGFLDSDTPGSADLELEYPLATLDVYVEGRPLPMSLRIGDPFHELYLCDSPDRGSPFLLDSVSCAPLLAPLTRYMPETLFEILPGRVTRLTMDDRIIELAGVGDRVWMNESGEKVELREVSRLIAFLSELSTYRVEALQPRGDQLDRWGLSSPETVITCTERGRELRLEIGAPIAGRRYFKRGDYPVVYSLIQEALELRWPEAQGH